MADEPVIDQRTTDLGTARLGPLMVKLSIPGMVGMLVMSLYNIVDTFWVSGLPNGTHAIAALTILFPVQMIVGAIGMGTAAGVTSLTSRRFGAARPDEANQAAGNAVSIALLLGAAACIWAEWILAPFAKEPELLRLGVISLRLRMCSFFLVEPQMMAVFSLQGMGMGGQAMLLTMARNTVFVVPALFVLSPTLGVVGAFAAQPVSDVLSLLVAAVMWGVYRKYPPSATAAIHADSLAPKAAGG